MTAKNTSEEPANGGLDQRNLSIQGSVDESTVVVGDRNIINQGPSYYTTNVFGAFATEQFPARPSQQLSKDEYRWRQVLVQNVKRYWVEGVLEKSLHNQVLIELGLEERTQAVAAPIGASEEFVEDAGRPFPAGTQAADIFDGLGAGRTLLILGEPGAGKTAMLLKLTKTLIARIGDDFSQPIPVVLNLSSWAKKRKSIAEWLVQDLYETFQVSKTLGTTWIQEERLTLCLDGLDEVESQYRNACVQALNHFLQTHGRTEVVVCSRIRDYEALSEQLRLRCAIYVQPLTAQQIDEYLEQAGEQLSALNTVLSHSPEVKAFAASPLILSVMSLACQGHLFNAFSPVDSFQDFRQQLFDRYIERMFLRRGKTENYTEQQATHWLVWMAQRMVGTSQTVFFIENMQPSWLRTRAQRLRYRLESSLFFGFIVWLSYGLGVAPSYGFIFGLGDGLSYGLSVALSYWLSVGLIAGLIAGLIVPTLGEITRVETLKWSWKATKNSCRNGLSYGLMGGLMGGLIYVLSDGLSDEPIYVLIGGLIGGLILGLIVGLMGGFKGPSMGQKTKPNQGIWQSAQKAGIFALIAGLTVGLIAGLLDGLIAGLTYGLIAGLIAGLSGGGSACLRHFSLRWMLYRMGYTPWNYARFLNYATERLFLQKVGGGYIFIHRMLLEHFAQMKLEQTNSK